MRPIDGGALWLDLMMLPHNGDIISSEDVERIILEAPTLDYKDLVPQGEWINCRGGDATCSRCRIRQKAIYDDDNEQHFCGHCGARMVSK